MLLNRTREIRPSWDKKLYRRLSPQLSLSLAFLVLLLFGTFLLMLPIATVGGRASFTDALFTSTSATCVTGLVVVDTSTYWSTFGKWVILFLIQVGGLGIMTFSTFFTYIVIRRLNIRSRDLMEHSFAGPNSQNLGNIILAIISLTLIIEFIGACILSLRFAQDFPPSEAIYLGIFHAISAFCNAGFSLFSNNLVDYRSDIVINLTIMFLIFVGGLGFWVLLDLKNVVKRKKNIHSTSLHTRIVIYTSVALVLIGFAAILLFEWGHSFLEFSVPDKIVTALFQSVSTRTAGFNTIDMNKFTNSSLFLIILLMFIGASPGSCGGGIKTTTITVFLALIISKLRSQKQVQLLKRGIPESTISKMIIILFFAIVVLMISITILLFTENPPKALVPERTLFIEVMFETASAMGTVGLSMGLTPILSEIGKIYISILMFIGRVGPVTVALALAGIKKINYRVAEENVWVG